MRASDRAYASLRQDILEGRLTPGTVLAEVDQAERLGISRTPLREALARLTAEGLTAPHQGRGVVVTGVPVERLTELFDVRLPLECAAARLAAQRGDPSVFAALADSFDSADSLIDAGGDAQRAYYELVARLDAAVDDAVGNDYLLAAQRQLRTHLVRVRRLARDNAARLRTSAAEHAQIARAVSLGNADLASAATAVHLHNSLHHMLATTAHSTTDPREELRNG